MKRNIKKNKLRTLISEGHLGGYIQGGDEYTWYPKLWKFIVKELNVCSVLDIGCAEGHAVKYFKKLGCEVLGIDGSSKAIEDSVIPENVIKHDFCKGEYIPNKKYDMLWSCEFVEHVRPRYLLNFLKTFEFSDKYIFMTHAQPGQCGWHHVNCRSDAYWIKLLSIIGFRFDSQLTKISRKLAQKGYFAKSGLVFVKNNLRTDPYILKKTYVKYLHIKMKIIDSIIFGPAQIYNKIIDKNIGLLGKLLSKYHPYLYLFLKKLKKKESQEI